MVFFNARRIATRSETKSIVDSSVKLVNEISDLSVGYWVGSPKDNEDRKFLLSVLAKSSQLQRYINILSKRGITLDISLLSGIADDATLDAEYASTQDALKREVKAQTIVESCMGAILHIYEKFEEVYPPVREIEMYDFFSWYDDHPSIPSSSSK